MKKNKFVMEKIKPEQHDYQIATGMNIPHFIARAFGKMNFKRQKVEKAREMAHQPGKTGLTAL